MTKSLIILGIIASISALFGCTPREAATSSSNSSQFTLLVTGVVESWDIQDVSKTKSAKVERTYAKLNVQKVTCDESPGFSEKLPYPFILNRTTVPQDREISVGDTVRLSVGVDKLPSPKYFYWVGTEKL